MRSDNPQSKRLYDLKVQSTTLSKQLKYEQNEKKIAEIERKLYKVESEIDMIYAAREGAEHMRWLISECGEDVFPDRD
jgi:hypothetical protein